MEASVQSALIAGLVAVFVAGLSNFGAESYKRHREAVSLAAGLAGELRGYLPVFDESIEVFSRLADRAAAGRLQPLTKIARPTSPIYEANAGKLGMLGVDLAEQVSFVYSCLDGFRSLMEAAQSATDPEEQARALVGAVMMLRKLEPATGVVQRLHAFAKREWLQPVIE